MIQKIDIKIEPIEPFGNILKNKRLELKMEISEICTFLKVKASDIEAIESEKWENITRHLYKPGLVISYAKILKIDPKIIDERVKSLPFESNVVNKKYQLINIGENIDLTPNKDMFFNFLLISALLLLTLLAFNNSLENRHTTITNDTLIKEMEKISQN